ncbi:hypothetical protein [Paracoccus alkanivorans]|uniref:Polyketide synthase n=1 Tax=Paracoccus alkanivorans TaxID=2116655 RepID=A0A3M0MB13_9RHOB|nr:hypothetical protein [Paracoccus alkanivorans]RMC34799.1 hypothetical protein C9E81_11920 [Paracoccus alkanivorans]
MRRVASIVVTLFLALYATGAVLHPAGASAMSFDMAISADMGMDMSDCRSCDVDEGGGAGQACDMICTTPMVAPLVASMGPLLAIPPTQEHPLNRVSLTGLIESPEPFPPRIFI